MEYRVCVLRAPGTNCDVETAWCVKSLGIGADIVHVKRFMEGEATFSNYDGLIIPGGFSFGDHVRAGALLGKMLKERFAEALWDFSREGRPILGICNGFQVLVECGLLPGDNLAAALTTNLSSKFESRWVHLKVADNCIFTKDLEGVMRLPVAHGEGRFLIPETGLYSLEKSSQIVFKYGLEDGTEAEGRYPENPNGSMEDIAGICNPQGTVLGLMPHPERAFYTFTYPRWTKKGDGSLGDGYKIFKNMVEHIRS
jgi:phosphoribosylformylglycinamidine synthase